MDGIFVRIRQVSSFRCKASQQSRGESSFNIRQTKMFNHTIFSPSPVTVTAFEPDFVFPLENVTVAQGRDASFTCVVNNLGGYRVSGSETPPARVCISFSMLCSFDCWSWHDGLENLNLILKKYLILFTPHRTAYWAKLK